MPERSRRATAPTETGSVRINEHLAMNRLHVAGTRPSSVPRGGGVWAGERERKQVRDECRWNQGAGKNSWFPRPAWDRSLDLLRPEPSAG